MPFSMEKEKVRETEPDDQVFDDPLKASPIGVRRVSTTLRQVLTEFSERFSFPQGNFAPGSPSNDDRQLGRPPASPLFLFHLPLPTGSGSGVGTGLLIQTALGRTGGLGALRTKRSG